MLTIAASDVARLYGMDEALACVREAAVAQASGRTVSPRRAALELPASQTELLVMPGVIDGTTFGLKAWYAVGGAEGALPRSSALLLLIDPELGEVVLDGGHITDLRTGAMTGLAAERLAPEGVTDVGVVGTGIQARTQILALVHVLRNVRTVKVTSRDPERRRMFRDAIASELASAYRDRTIDVIAVGSAQDACHGSGVVVAATTSSSPVVRAGWLEPHVLVCGVGSHSPGDAEIEQSVVAGARRVVVDTLAGGVDGAGDVLAAIEAGELRREDVVELGDLLSESVEPPSVRKGVSVFKSVGFSAADVYSARFVARRARTRGVAVALDLHA